MTKTQVDRLGDRIKRGEISEDDLRALDSYRKSFEKAYEAVIATMRRTLFLEPTGRPAKSISVRAWMSFLDQKSVVGGR